VATSRRFSRGVPYNTLMTKEQQEGLLALLAGDAEFREGVETLLGITDLLKLAKQEQIAAVRRYTEAAGHKALLSQMAGADREFAAEVALKRDEISLADRLALAEAENETLRERLGESTDGKQTAKRAVRRKAVKG